ncbi:MAG: ribonuclease P protein component [Chloroflexi bacterium]|nr:ribonuclease P protein component [Chloroflexota bacterium]
MRREQRLTRRSDFEHTRVHGKRASDRLFVLGAAQSGASVTRFGLAVSKRVGGAVVRNRLKRRIRGVLDTLSFEEGWNVVIAARPAAAAADSHVIRDSLTALARRLRLLGAQ